MSGARRAGPRRSCVACRGEEDRDDLVRLVRDPDGCAVVDLRARLPGRGAWVHPTRACVGRVERERALLARALGEPTDASGLDARLRDAVLRAVLDGLSLARAGGGLVGGHDAIEAAARDGRVVELVVASDASERTVADLRAAGPDLAATVVPLDREALGARVGTAPRAALGVTSAPSATHLRRQLHRFRALG